MRIKINETQLKKILLIESKDKNILLEEIDKSYIYNLIKQIETGDKIEIKGSNYNLNFQVIDAFSGIVIMKNIDGGVYEDYYFLLTPTSLDEHDNLRLKMVDSKNLTTKTPKEISQKLDKVGRQITFKKINNFKVYDKNNKERILQKYTINKDKNNKTTKYDKEDYSDVERGLDVIRDMLLLMKKDHWYKLIFSDNSYINIKPIQIGDNEIYIEFDPNIELLLKNNPNNYALNQIKRIFDNPNFKKFSSISIDIENPKILKIIKPKNKNDRYDFTFGLYLIISITQKNGKITRDKLLLKGIKNIEEIKDVKSFSPKPQKNDKDIEINDFDSMVKNKLSYGELIDLYKNNDKLRNLIQRDPNVITKLLGIKRGGLLKLNKIYSKYNLKSYTDYYGEFKQNAYHVIKIIDDIELSDDKFNNIINQLKKLSESNKLIVKTMRKPFGDKAIYLYRTMDNKDKVIFRLIRKIDKYEYKSEIYIQGRNIEKTKIGDTKIKVIKYNY